MGFVAFLIEERGAKTSGAALSVEEPSVPDEFSRAVDDLVSRKALDDPETAQMIAAHFAEVVINKYLADDEATAHKAANALISVLGQPYLMVRRAGCGEISRSPRSRRSMQAVFRGRDGLVGHAGAHALQQPEH